MLAKIKTRSRLGDLTKVNPHRHKGKAKSLDTKIIIVIIVTEFIGTVIYIN